MPRSVWDVLMAIDKQIDDGFDGTVVEQHAVRVALQQLRHRVSQIEDEPYPPSPLLKYLDIRVTIRDHEAFTAVDLPHLNSYLEMHEWESTTPDSARALPFNTWTKDGFTIDVPIHDRYVDYPHRISEVLQALEAEEERSQLSIYYEVMLAPVEAMAVKETAVD